jgi:type II secretory pathway pseudopilin PulG
MPNRFNSRSRIVSKASQLNRSGLSLVELMIALTMTLIVLGAMMSAFQFASAEMQKGRAMMELSNRLRIAEQLMRHDLENATIDPVIYTENVIPNGAFEIVEGPNRGFRGFYGIDLDNDGIADRVDASSTGGPDNNGNGIDDTFEPANYLDDIDDCLVLTVRSPDQPYRGRITRTTATAAGATTGPPDNFEITRPFDVPELYESQLAEIVWWTDYADRAPGNLSVDFDESVIVFRRVLLVMGNAIPPHRLPKFFHSGFGSASADQAYLAAVEYLATNDISARILPSDAATPGTPYFQIVANTLQDLSRRENRFCRSNFTTRLPDGTLPFAGSPFPSPLNRGQLAAARASEHVVVDTTDPNYPFDDLDGLVEGGDRYALRPTSSDVVLTDVVGFDIKVLAPNAVVQQVASLGAGGALTEVTLVEPHDFGFSTGIPDPTFGTVGVAADTPTLQNTVNSAFVDLGHRGTLPSEGVPVGSTANTKSWFSNRDIVNTGYALYQSTPAPAGIFANRIFDPLTGPVLAPSNPFDRASIDYQYRFDALPDAAGSPFNPFNELLETVWDAWTPSYENDGVDQDRDGFTDEFTDGLDTDFDDSVVVRGGSTNQWNDGANGLIDDVTERETTPPYAYPLRGVKVTFRIVEKGTKQVRQTSVVQSFVPQ